MKLVTNGEDEKCVRCGKTIRKGTGFYAYPEGPVCVECVSKKEKKK
jgi:hypothetical protein